MAMFDLYKQGQGKNVRMGTLLSGMLLAVVGAYWLSERLKNVGGTWETYVRFGIPVLVLGGVGWLLFWLINKPRLADFMIATEGEMKKVSWSSRREIIGSTKVVIFATFAMATVLFVVDTVFQVFFTWIKVLQLTGS